MTHSLDRADVALRLLESMIVHGVADLPSAIATAVRGAESLLLALTPPVAPEVLTPDVPEGSTIAQLAAEQRASMGLTASMGATQHFKHPAPVAPKSEAAKYVPKVGDVVRFAHSVDSYAAVVRQADERGFRLCQAGCDDPWGLDLPATDMDRAVYLRPATPAERKAAGIIEPSPEATRPTHIRVVRRGKNAPPFVTDGAVLKVDEWDAAGDPWVGDGRWCFCGHRDPALSNTTWEPATPPAPVAPKSEAAKYEPRVGDVFAWPEESDAEAEEAYARVVSGPLKWTSVDGGKKFGGFIDYPIIGACRYLRPATPAERAAAGLPSPEATRPTHVFHLRSAVSRTEPRKVVRWYGNRPVIQSLADGSEVTLGGTDLPWEPCSPPPAPVEPAKGEDRIEAAAKRLDERAASLDKHADSCPPSERAYFRDAATETRECAAVVRAARGAS